MNKIMRKLRSRKGVSMLIAMVFLLFTSFVGGSVLVAATSNAYRVAHLKDQQDYLTQRSAALLISDELKLNRGKQLKLNVVDATKTSYEVEVFPNGGWEKVRDPATGEEKPPLSVERVITFQVVTNLPQLSPMQQMMLEATVWRYLQSKPTQGNGVTQSIVLQNFPHVPQNGVTPTTSDFWYQWKPEDGEIEGSLQVSGTATIKNSGTVTILDGFDVNFVSGEGAEIYDYILDFGEFSQLKITMNAFSGATSEIELDAPPAPSASSSTGYVLVSTKSNQTAISWDDPFIQKGGA